MSTTAEVDYASRLSVLRINAFAALVMLLVEYSLGMWVNLDATVPATDHGSNIVVAIGRAIANGPVGLSIHAIIGLGLIGSATGALIRAIRLGRTPWTVITGAALAAILLAVISGSRFVSTNDNGASLAMALFAAVAMFCYGLVLFRATR